MLDVGERGVQIAKFLDLDDDTGRTRYKTTREGGWDTLSSNDWKRDRSRMALTQETELFEWLDGRLCSSMVEIGVHILKEFGLDYSESGCLKLPARLGFEYRKPKNLRRIASAEQQAECIDMCERLLKGCAQMKRYISRIQCVPSIKRNPHMAGSRQAAASP